MSARLTRQEQQQRTRTRLMRAAAKVFCRKGLEGASIDEVAQEAGYTKGAFYANFASKQELFLAMLDERFGERIEEVSRAFGDADSPPEQARHAAEDFTRAVRASTDEEGLFLEFASYALRDEEFRQELVTRFASLRERLEEIFTKRIESYELDLDIPVDRIVRMVIAMADGWCLWTLLEPDAVDDELYAQMVELFTIGVGVRGGVLDRPGAVTPDQ